TQITRIAAIVRHVSASVPEATVVGDGDSDISNRRRIGPRTGNVRHGCSLMRGSEFAVLSNGGAMEDSRWHRLSVAEWTWVIFRLGAAVPAIFICIVAARGNWRNPLVCLMWVAVGGLIYGVLIMRMSVRTPHQTSSGRSKLDSTPSGRTGGHS